MSKPVVAEKYGKLKAELEQDEDTPESNDEDGDSGEECEFDEEALRKLLERKIEQAPAAKVIVSDAMMREALSEISARKSGISTDAKSSTASMLTVFSREDQSTTTATSSSVSVPTTKSGKTVGYGKDKGSGDAQTTNQKSVSNVASLSSVNFGNTNLGEANSCPLEMILEFLQAVMAKEYKKAFGLAKEVEKHEPNNELILEYKTVLEKIISKEEENDNAEGSDADSNKSSADEAGDYSDEFTTSSETDSDSEEEDSESSTESRSSTSSTLGESDKDEEAQDEIKVDIKECEDGESKQNILEENKEAAGMMLDAAESSGNVTDTGGGRGEDEVKTQCGGDNNAEHTNPLVVEDKIL